MNLRIFLIPALGLTLAISGCAGLGGGSSSDSETASPSSGRGGPTVSDSEIMAAIQQAFKQDPELATASITVKVEKGIVTLSGNAPNAQSYNRAISLARNAPGVRPPVIASGLRFPS
jgi:osmotically-inducible protein OsmY